jgi:hypothetical protein
VSDYRLVERVPLVEDYNRVRTEAGLCRRDPAAAEVGLPNTLFGVCVESDERVVGIGRIIGDGGLFFQVVDVAFVPEHQREELGAMVMDTLMSWLRDNASTDAYVQLIRRGSHGVLREVRLPGTNAGGIRHVVHDSIGSLIPINYQVLQRPARPALGRVSFGVS